MPWHRSWPTGGASLDLGNMSRPYVRFAGDENPRRITVAIAWGTRNGDPVWLVEQRVPVPACIGRRWSW